MSTDCDVCIGGFAGSVEFFYEEERRARKPHTCHEGCGRTIQPGEKYRRVGGKCEGEMWRASVCAFCWEIGEVFACGQSRSFGDLWEQMEYIMPDLRVTSPCFNKLSLEARAFLTERWWDWKERQ